MSTFFTLISSCFLLRCRKNHPAWAVLSNYRYAHRGYHDKPQVPENSMAAFRRAVERGWGAELDVHLMKDGTLAVIHDSSLKRTAGAEVNIEDLTRADLEHYHLEGTEEKIPLFDEVLELYEGKVPLIIELKTAPGNHAALAKAVCERLDRYKGDFCIESFNPAVLRDVKKLRPHFCRGQLSRDFFSNRNETGMRWFTAFLGTHLLLNCYTVPDFVAFRFEDRKRSSMQVCVKYWKAKPVYWTITSKEDLLTAEAEGALAIFERFDPDK